VRESAGAAARAGLTPHGGSRQAVRPQAIVDLIRSAETMRIDRSGAGGAEPLPAPGSCERCGYITSQARGALAPLAQRCSAAVVGARMCHQHASPGDQHMLSTWHYYRLCCHSLSSVCRVAASAAAESHARPARSSCPRPR